MSSAIGKWRAGKPELTAGTARFPARKALEEFDFD
jgi:hypothetical protein